jgi:hypothetical protein
MDYLAQVWQQGRWVRFHRQLMALWFQPERLPFRIRMTIQTQAQNSLQRSHSHTIPHL